MRELAAILAEIRRRPGEPLALATVVRVRGHAYRRPGARLLMNAEGPLLGGVSAGCLEGDVLARGREVLASGLPQVLVYDLRSDLDLVWGSGSGCEGEATLRVERVDPGAPWIRAAESALARRAPLVLRTPFETPEGEAGALVEELQPPVALWIFGAGEGARPLAALARVQGWRVGVCDHRPAFARPERFPEAEEVRAGHPRQLIPGLPLDARSACLLMTHHYAKDLEALRLLLPSSAGYLGLLGHRERGRRLLEELEEEGLRPSRAQRERLYAPVGLDLGGQDPEDMALSILAEIQAHFAGAGARPLREGRGAIHAAP